MPWSKQMRLESAAFVVFRPCMSVLNNILMTVFLKDFVSLLRNDGVGGEEWRYHNVTHQLAGGLENDAFIS